MPIFANSYPKAHEEESLVSCKTQKPIQRKAQSKARPKGPPRRPKSKKGPKKEMQRKAICSRIQICCRIQFSGRMASADKDKLGPKTHQEDRRIRKVQKKK